MKYYKVEFDEEQVKQLIAILRAYEDPDLDGDDAIIEANQHETMIELLLKAEEVNGRWPVQFFRSDEPLDVANPDSAFPWVWVGISRSCGGGPLLNGRVVNVLRQIADDIEGCGVKGVFNLNEREQ